MLSGIAAAATALLLSALLTGVLRVPALRLGIADRRRRRSVPLSGGTAVALATALVATAADATGLVPLGAGVGRMVAAAGCVAALGLAADVWRLRRWVAPAGTAVAAAFVVPYGETGVAGGVLAAGWIVAATVAFRGLDHADGLAGTVGAVGAFGAAACATAELMDGLAALLGVLAAALAGFLLHNWFPAQAGLGAGGALFTGFVLASSAVFVRAGQGIGAGVAVVSALTALACADAVLVVLGRRLDRRPVTRGRPDHLGHRLRRLGLAPRAVPVLLGAGSAGAALVGVCVHTGRLSPGAVGWVAAAAAVLVLVLVRRPVTPVFHPRQRVASASSQVSERLRVSSG
ncbi:undecaprenyl/decaprenyl-phosphate alpha-N-acetylglucosaminyl 1-phosphate transferase [Streptomyces sp. MA15]|uniref:undecaprenyl/decaprenyl-phosphate alpha-N-acetylglucosaminyl 1-phosphate transferase n=1 Tax=Streptomyces sp. MA15 TaxID=3055061 RepID=UPI0025AF3BA3|nr:undecaprenyl/decaprenyl-phosphate alpha-N-acetylglucosaminyl 1-phosphate transferase [Streptomyces sp. MA15]MDN3268200.1 undecaprenyl/decaprenyl-phosphate alpha-N-acetylglucosaminyl 1-phosphate transferase [Streptomyces sp. MA15]